jgi:16S rRNA G966 N2-methylase RsmD
VTALALPEPGSPEVSQREQALAVLDRLEAGALGDDPELMAEAHRQAAALETYGAHWSGVCRMVEVVIGERLGEPEPGGRGKVGRLAYVPARDRVRFRQLARARPLVTPIIRLAVEAGERLPRETLLWTVRRAERQHVDAEARSVELAEREHFTGEGWSLYAGDADEVLADLSEGCADLVLTDPPYPAEDLGAWSVLAKHAARVLVPDGILCALSGQIMLPEVLARLGEHLAYGWTYCQPLPGSSSRIRARRIGQAWKPWLAHSNGPWPSGRIDWHPDVLDGAPMAKAGYRWEQSTGPAAQLIHFLCPEGGVVLDPFTGTGAYGEAALRCGRRFVGIEADAGRARRAAARLTRATS